MPFSLDPLTELIFRNPVNVLRPEASFKKGWKLSRDLGIIYPEFCNEAGWDLLCQFLILVVEENTDVLQLFIFICLSRRG